MANKTKSQLLEELKVLNKQIDKFRRSEKEREKAENINQVLFAISNAVNTTDNLDELFETIHKILSQIIDVTNFHISLYNKYKDSLVFRYIVDTVDNPDKFMEIKNISDPNSPYRTSDVIRTGEPILQKKDEFLKQLKRKKKKPMFSVSKIWLGVPLKIKDEVIGAIVVHSHTDPDLYDASDVDLLLSVSDQVAIAIDRKRKEEALKLNEKNYRNIVENIDDIIFSTDSSGAFTYISPAVETITGYSRNNIIGDLGDQISKTSDKNVWYRCFSPKKYQKNPIYENIIHPDDRMKVIREINNAYKNTSKYNIEYRINKKNGKENWVFEKGRVFIDDNNKKYLEGAISDIQERKRAALINNIMFRISNAVNTTIDLNELYKSIHNILNSITDATNFFIATYDKKHDMLSMEYYVDQVDKKALKLIHKTKNISKSSALTAKVIKSGQPLLIKKDERILLSKAEKRDPIGVPAEVWLGIPLKINNETIGVMAAQSYTDPNHYSEKDIAYLHSVSDQIAIAIQRKRAEEALRQSISNANHLAKKAKTAELSKSEFLANMSHEIRTPLNAITGFADLALKTELNPKQLDYLSLIKNASKSLLCIINDILDLSKIEAGKLNLDHTDFDLYDVMESLSDMFANKISERNIEMIVSVDVDLPSKLIGDPMRLKQVLFNLTGNAIKFTNQGEVIIKAELTDRKKGYVSIKFSITDTGIGISKENINKLFDSFVQAENSTTRKYGGTGLGLSISKQLIELMGGGIHVESEENKGSKFWFTAKFGYYPHEKKVDHFLVDKNQGIKILIAVDNDSSRLNLKKILTSYSFGVETVSSTHEVLKEISDASRRKSYNLILLDLTQSELDGLETAKLIRSNNIYGNIPIILMTAYKNDEIIENPDKPLINAYLTKPMKQSVLLETIVGILGNTGLKNDTIEKRNHNISMFENHFSGIRILLVEDNIINQEVVLEILKSTNATVDTAENGIIAVNAVKNNEYDAVLMDIQMPEMDGYEATDHIRNKLNNKNLPIIAMTAHAMKGDREKCINAGMNDYVAKPISMQQIISVLDKYIDSTSKSVDSAEPAEYERDDLDLSREEYNDSDKKLLPDQLPGIDIKLCLDRLGGNEQVLKKVICDFNDQYTTVVGKIKNSLKNDNQKEVLHIVHTIKGIAGNFSAKDLYDASLALETAVKNNKNEDLQQLILAFEKAIEPVLQAGSILKSDHVESKSLNQVTSNQSKMMNLMNELNFLLLKNDVRSENCLNSLKPFLNKKQLQPNIRQLENHINFFDFESAKTVLGDIASSLDIILDVNVQ